MNKKTTLLFIIMICFKCIIAQSINTVNSDAKSQSIKEVRISGYKLINPLLDYYEINSSSIKSNKLLQKKIYDYLQKEIANKNIESGGVYYRDLNNGPWIGVNEDVLYSPASLLKIPYLLATLKQAENNPSFLKKRVLCGSTSTEYKQSIVTDFHMIEGKSYSIDELLYYMIAYSDNVAKDMIINEISYENYFETFNDLGINIAKYDTLDIDFLSVKEYASFFRILYNSTFLNKKMSEAALSLLTKTKFNSGIVAGIPDTVMVAHKFGERFYFNSEVKQLHDCGIVYKKNQPYILCIMTKGKDYIKLQKVISEISQIVYNHLDTNSKSN